MSFNSGTPPDPVESAAKGAVKAVLEYSEEKLKELVERFKNKDLVFIQDKEIIEIAKEQRAKGEWAFFKIYVKDNDLRILFQMGLTLRELEKKLRIVFKEIDDIDKEVEEIAKRERMKN